MADGAARIPTGMRSGFHRFARHVLRVTCCVAFATKLLIPVGYMPSSLADGWPIKLCDAGLPVIGHSAHHSHHDNHGDNSHEQQWKYCPLGVLAAAAAVPGAYELVLPNGAGAADPPFLPIAQPLAPRAIGFRSRAPPLPEAMI